MRLASSILLSSALLGLGATVAPASEVTTQRIVTGLVQPVYCTAPAGDSRLFILEQRGVIRIYAGGTLLARPFLDINVPVNSSGTEQGLLGLAFPADFDSSQQFYVYYTGGTGNGTSVIERYTVSSDPDSADASSAELIYQVNQPASNHNGGHIAFGPHDGYLYFGLGDGGSGGDPWGNAQNPLTLMGKMIRIDPTSDDFPGDPFRNFAIPPSNPFANDPNVRDEIWALGMRNPYRFSFDRDNHHLFIADVGQNCYEEIDWQPSTSTGGQNYGWDVKEAAHCFNENDFNECDFAGPCTGPYTDPIYEYDHTTEGFSCSVTGGYVYRGGAIPKIQGHYFFADYCSDHIYSFRNNGAFIQGFQDRTTQLEPDVGSIRTIAGFGEDGFGEMYIVDRGGGEIFKMIPAPATDTLPNPDVGSGFQLSAGRPNPFTAATRFSVTLQNDSDLSVAVYGASGRLVRRIYEGPAAAGSVDLEWRGRDGADRPVPAGVYFLRAESGEGRATQRITLLK